MKRTPLRRATALRRGAPLARKPRTKAESERIYGSDERQAWYRAHGCVCCARIPVQLHHVRNGGMGKKASADLTIPLCASCHDTLHRMGVRSFEHVNRAFLSHRTLREWAAKYAAAWAEAEAAWRA